MTSNTFNKFILDDVFPDPEKVFAPSCPRLDDLKATCLYVFDANALLAPFELDIASDIVPIYTSLYKSNRLFTTKRSVQEFARNRQRVLAKAYRAVHDSKSTLPPSNPPSFPFLHSIKEYKALTDAAEKVKEARRSYVTALENLEHLLLDWTWEDPISTLYRSAFTGDTIVDHGLDSTELAKDIENRHLHLLPPGYKDKNKPDSGVGDILIWHSVIAAATKHQKNIVIVSNESKADWVVTEGTTAIGLRPELEYEFRHKTNRFVAIASYSRFLEMNHAKQETVEKARSIESVEIHDIVQADQRLSALIHELASMVERFLNTPNGLERLSCIEEWAIDSTSAMLHKHFPPTSHSALQTEGARLYGELRFATDVLLRSKIRSEKARRKGDNALATSILMKPCAAFLNTYREWRRWYSDVRDRLP